VYYGPIRWEENIVKREAKKKDHQPKGSIKQRRESKDSCWGKSKTKGGPKSFAHGEFERLHILRPSQGKKDDTEKNRTGQSGKPKTEELQLFKESRNQFLVKGTFVRRRDDSGGPQEKKFTGVTVNGHRKVGGGGQR